MNGENLVNAVANSHHNTIVIVNSVGPSIVESWADHPNVTAVCRISLMSRRVLTDHEQILWAGVSGQEVGDSITDVLYGTVSPSGRLPYTIAKSISDYPAPLTIGGTANDILSIPYTEGLHIDYRHFDAVGRLIRSMLSLD